MQRLDDRKKEEIKAERESDNLEQLMNLRMLQDGAMDSEFQWLL